MREPALNINWIVTQLTSQLSEARLLLRHWQEFYEEYSSRGVIHRNWSMDALSKHTSQLISTSSREGRKANDL